MEHNMTGDLFVGFDEPPSCSTHQASLLKKPCSQQDRIHPLNVVTPWNDWKWQMRNRIRTVQELIRSFPSLADHQLQEVVAKYPLAITPYYASLIQRADPSDPIFQMSVPRSDELCDPPFLKADPLHEEEDMPVPGLVHRYPDRALIMATTSCSMYCRHCTRKRVAGSEE